MNRIDHDTVLFRTERLCKLYPDGQVHAVEDVNIGVRRGEYVAIMGPSGSGKSTLLNLLGALDRPTSGEVYFDGNPLSGIRNVDRMRSQTLGFVFQSFYLLPILTALENVQVPMFEGPLSASQRVARAKELLDLVGLSHRMPHAAKALGRRAAARGHRPVAGQRPNRAIGRRADGQSRFGVRRGRFRALWRLHRQRGMTIVLITHDEEFGHRAQRTIRMQDGHVKSDVFSERHKVRTPLPPFAV